MVLPPAPPAIDPALFVCDIEKLYQGEYWTNRYVLAVADVAAGIGVGQQIAAAERNITLANVLFTKLRVSDAIPGTDNYSIHNINQFGLRPADPTLLPLFNVLRVDFSTFGNGRPSRKYLRGVLAEGNIEFNTINYNSIEFYQNNYCVPLLAIPGFVDVDNQAFSAASPYPFVGMRQLRRGSKRKKDAPAVVVPG
jgi:hypothetical protein